MATIYYYFTFGGFIVLNGPDGTKIYNGYTLKEAARRYKTAAEIARAKLVKMY